MLRYAITDRAALPGDEASRQSALLAQAANLAPTVDFFQLREPDLPAAALVTLARRILTALRTQSPSARLLIHSRADIALATASDGVHLSSAPGALTAPQIRQLYAARPNPIVSISCHTLDEVARARDHGATLILFGPVFEKQVHGRHISAGCGLDTLHAACEAARSTPVLALGGITPETIPAVLNAGAAGIAAIRLFQPTPPHPY